MTAGPVGRFDPVQDPAVVGHVGGSPRVRGQDGSPADPGDAPDMPPPRPDGAPDDRTLLAGVSAGDEAAFARLFHRYYATLCAFAIRYTGTRTPAEEVVEDVLTRLWEVRAELDVRESLRSYLYAAVRNRALNRARGERVEGRALERALANGTMPGMAQPQSPLDEEVQADEFAAAVERAVEELPPRTREVFLLHRQRGLTYVRIADQLGITPKTVENLLGRALKHLRRRLALYLAG